jgi:hypothetical protein
MNGTFAARAPICTSCACCRSRKASESLTATHPFKCGLQQRGEVRAVGRERASRAPCTMAREAAEWSIGR